VVPSSSGSFAMANLDRAGQAGLIHAFSELLQPLDVLLIDTAAGLNHSVLTFSEAAQRVLVLVCDEPSSLADAYGLIKVLRLRKPDCRVQVIANMVDSPAQGQALFEKLARVSRRFLGVSPGYLGCIPQDRYLRRAVQQQAAVVVAYPGSPSAIAFRKLAMATDEWTASQRASGGVVFFIARLACAAAPRTASPRQFTQNDRPTLYRARSWSPSMPGWSSALPTSSQRRCPRMSRSTT